MVLSWNLQNMLETPFPSFISKNRVKFWYFELFLAKIQFCPIFPWKSAFSGRPCLKTSLWRHTLADFQNFGISRKGRPSPILWYHTLILWACQSKVHGGGNHPPLGRCVTENTLGRRGLTHRPFQIDPFLIKSEVSKAKAWSSLAPYPLHGSSNHKLQITSLCFVDESTPFFKRFLHT